MGLWTHPKREGEGEGEDDDDGDGDDGLMERFIVRYHVYMCSPFPSFAAAAAAADAMAAVALNSLGSNSNPFQFLIIGIIDHFTVWYPIANNRKSGTRIAMGRFN